MLPATFTFDEPNDNVIIGEDVSIIVALVWLTASHLAQCFLLLLHEFLPGGSKCIELAPRRPAWFTAYRAGSY